DLASRHDRNLVVEQGDERAKETRLRLAAQSKEEEVVLRQQRVYQLRHDRLVVADDAGEERLAGAKLAAQVIAYFLVHGAARYGGIGDGATQSADGGKPCGPGHLWVLLNAQCSISQ